MQLTKFSTKIIKSFASCLELLWDPGITVGSESLLSGKYDRLRAVSFVASSPKDAAINAFGQTRIIRCSPLSWAYVFTHHRSSAMHAAMENRRRMCFGAKYRRSNFEWHFDVTNGPKLKLFPYLAALCACAFCLRYFWLLCMAHAGLCGHNERINARELLHIGCSLFNAISFPARVGLL